MALSRILLFSQFEFSRFVFSRRGVIALCCYLLTWALVLTQLVSGSADLLRNPNFSEVIQDMMGQTGFAELTNWTVPEMVLYWLVAVISFPVLSVFASADQLCSDRERGTLRFILLRATRFELMIGRFTGQLLLNASFILLSIIAVILLVWFKGQSSLTLSIPIAVLVFFSLLVTVLPVIAFMTLLNTITRSSKQAIIYYLLFSLVILVLIGLVSSYVHPDASYALYALPNVNWISRLQLGLNSWLGWGVPIIQALLYLIMAHWILRRSAL